MSKEELPMIIPEKKMAIKRQKQRNIEGIKCLLLEEKLMVS